MTSSSFHTPPAKQRLRSTSTPTTRQQQQEKVPSSVVPSADYDDRRVCRQADRERQGLWNVRSPKPPQSFQTSASITAKVGYSCDNESFSTASNINNSSSAVPSALPATKTIYLIRHGESLGQCALNRNQRQTDPALLDCGLSELGIQQALALKQCLQTTTTATSSPGGSTNATSATTADADCDTPSSIMSNIQLVLCSPLTRALQTACLVFGQDDDGTENQTASTLGSLDCIPPPPPLLPILVHYHLREIGSQIPENMPRSPLVVQCHLQTVSPVISRRVVERQLNAELLLPDPSWPNDTTASSANALRRESIADILRWLAHGRTETCIAIVCHYHVIRAALLQHQVVAANEMSPIKASLTTGTTTTPLKSLSQTDPTTTTTTTTTPPPPNKGHLAATTSSPGPRHRRRQANANLHPTNACLWRCDLNCVTGRLTLVQVIR
jgi:broad specificity phosphatase PhoE